MDYPAIHDAASKSSDAAQRKFLMFIRVEFGTLAAVSAGYLLLPNVASAHTALAVLVVFSAAIFWYRSLKKPDEDWYQFRALAESAKTLAWRYAMRAQPFHKEDAMARATLRNKLKELLAVNASLGARLEPHAAEQAQVTPEMEQLRASPVADRANIYIKNRIDDQRRWYALKAVANKKSGRTWSVIVTMLYGAIAVILLSRISYPELSLLSPDPLLVICSSLIGWIQVKKFNELAAAYFLTAQEIGIVAISAVEAVDEKSLSDFVNGAELVFSREHTQWVARRRT